jgi:hypothetical protein
VDIVGDAYPPGISVPLQGMALIQRYGQQISLKAVQAQRKAGEWQAPPFDHMTDRQVYIYLNNNDILGNAIAADPSYPETPPPAAWAPFFAAPLLGDDARQRRPELSQHSSLPYRPRLAVDP